jgi:cyclic nucleotide gated channel
MQVLGALWYLFSVQRQEACWREACHLEGPMCQTEFFDCNTISSNRTIWYELSNITSLCTPSNSFYQFGIYAEAFDYKLTTSTFVEKYFYCFWWGLKNLRLEIKCIFISYISAMFLTNAKIYNVSVA